jgi:type I restriction enzyme, S subunit
MSDLPNGWATAYLGDVCEIARGGSPRPIKDYLTEDPDGINWIKISDATESEKYIFKTKQKIIRDGISKSRMVKNGDFILSNSMSFGRPYIVATEGCIHDGWLVLSMIHEVFDRDYLYLFLSSQEAYRQFDSMAAGSTVRNLNIDIVKTVEALIPPLAEQRRIVAKLDSLLDRSRRARQDLERIPKLLDRYKQAILSAAFNGDLTADWREKQNLKEIREMVSLQSVASSFNYGTSAKSSSSGTTPVLRMGNIQDGKLDWNDLVFTSDTKEIDKYTLLDGDVLFNRTNSPELVGKTAVYKGSRSAIYAGYLIRVRCNYNLIPDYLNYCLNSPEGRDYCSKVKSDGVSQSNINAKKLAAFTFELPSIQEQKEIVKRIEKLFKAIDLIAAEYDRAIKLLDRLDRSILAKAFRGELVHQDPNDEPATVLLERIQKDRSTQTNGKKVKSK